MYNCFFNFYLLVLQTEKVNGEWRDLGTCSEPITQSFQHTTYMMGNLKPDTTYKVELRAHNAIGHSTPAEVRIRTARGEPSDKYYSYYYSSSPPLLSSFGFLFCFVVCLVHFYWNNGVVCVRYIFLLCFFCPTADLALGVYHGRSTISATLSCFLQWAVTAFMVFRVCQEN